MYSIERIVPETLPALFNLYNKMMSSFGLNEVHIYSQFGLDLQSPGFDAMGLFHNSSLVGFISGKNSLTPKEYSIIGIYVEKAHLTQSVHLATKFETLLKQHGYESWSSDAESMLGRRFMESLGAKPITYKKVL